MPGGSLYFGEAGIRTLGALTGSTVFETAPFDRSGTSPRLNIEKAVISGKSIVTDLQDGVPLVPIKNRDAEIRFALAFRQSLEWYA